MTKTHIKIQQSLTTVRTRTLEIDTDIINSRLRSFGYDSLSQLPEDDLASFLLNCQNNATGVTETFNSKYDIGKAVNVSFSTTTGDEGDTSSVRKVEVFNKSTDQNGDWLFDVGHALCCRLGTVHHSGPKM